MEDILYVKAEQNVAVKKKDLQIKDVAPFPVSAP